MLGFKKKKFIGFNGKADTLSRIDSKETETHDHDTILPDKCWINAIECDFDKELNNTLPYHRPAEYPEKK